MTRNQVDYLNMEETKRNNLVVAEETAKHNRNVEAETNRNNLVIEAQGADRNAETKRDNLARLRESKRASVAALKETKKHNRATEKNAATVPIAQSTIAAEASKTNTQVTTAAKYADIANQAAMNARTNTTQTYINDMKNKTQIYLKSLESLMNDKRLTQAERASIRSAAKDIKIAMARINADATQKDLDRFVKVLTSTQGTISALALGLGTAGGKAAKSKASNATGGKGKALPTTAVKHSARTSQGRASAAKKKVKKSKSPVVSKKNQRMNQYKPGLYNQKSGAQPASSKSTTDNTKSTPTKKLVIYTKGPKKGQSYTKF